MPVVSCKFEVPAVTFCIFADVEYNRCPSSLGALHLLPPGPIHLDVLLLAKHGPDYLVKLLKMT
jgi:hypothetical protein